MADKAETKNEPKNDRSQMTNEYIKGATPADLAEKYDLTAQEVLDIVTQPAPVFDQFNITQEALDEQEAKKGK